MAPLTPRDTTTYPSGDAAPGMELSKVLPGSTEVPPTTTDKLSVHLKAPAFSFGGRTKKALPADTPGAGTYEVERVELLARYGRTPKFSFGATSRHDPRRPRQPGPGAYTVPQTFGRTGPSVSCAPRREVRAPSQARAPGPGSHDLPGSIAVKGPTLSKSPRRMIDGTARATPGPGAYDSHRDGALRPRSTPRWGFGTSRQRPKDVAEVTDSTPGPGAYRHHSQLKGPKFSIRANTAAAKEGSQVL
mmetsp:Transcript_33946/g.97769  ORF Transcript_33946/g.97769 Transcript_33946/m.97769 type:complete len:246 (+) Transcript_33946:22-759(+)